MEIEKRNLSSHDVVRKKGTEDIVAIGNATEDGLNFEGLWIKPEYLTFLHEGTYNEKHNIFGYDDGVTSFTYEFESHDFQINEKRIGEGGTPILIVRAKYVHQIQQCLRIVGRGDIAEEIFKHFFPNG